MIAACICIILSQYRSRRRINDYQKRHVMFDCRSVEVTPRSGAPLRISATVTPTPRWARSIAKLIPTGPPPTIKTSVLTRRAMNAPSRRYRQPTLTR
jgi:hypothetical protein